MFCAKVGLLLSLGRLGFVFGWKFTTIEGKVSKSRDGGRGEFVKTESKACSGEKVGRQVFKS